MDKIELKELAPYLPYGLKFKDDREGFGEIYELTDWNLHIVMENIKAFNNVKPFVRPLSQLTQEIEHNGKRFVPDEQLCGVLKTEDYSLWFTGDFFSFKRKKYSPLGFSLSEYQKLFEWHFDIHNWLGRGLAIPIEN